MMLKAFHLYQLRIPRGVEGFKEPLLTIQSIYFLAEKIKIKANLNPFIVIQKEPPTKKFASGYSNNQGFTFISFFLPVLLAASRFIRSCHLLANFIA